MRLKPHHGGWGHPPYTASVFLAQVIAPALLVSQDDRTGKGADSFPALYALNGQ